MSKLMCSPIGGRYRLLDEYPSEPYTDVYWIKFADISAARLAKRKADNRSFFGKTLHVCYAPEFESVADTREKLKQRRKVIAQKTRGKRGTHLPLHLLHNDNLSLVSRVV